MYGLIAAGIIVYYFRLVHGIAAANHCLWEQTRCICDGCSVPHGSSGHGCCFHSCTVGLRGALLHIAIVQVYCAELFLCHKLGDCGSFHHWAI